MFKHWLTLVESRDALLQNEADTLRKSLEQRYAGLDLWFHIGAAGDLVLSKIVVSEKSQGTGTAVMQELTNFADQHGIPITLTPDKVYGGSVTRLRTFYRRFGFRPNKGSLRDYRYSGAMLRRPAKT